MAKFGERGEERLLGNAAVRWLRELCLFADAVAKHSSVIYCTETHTHRQTHRQTHTHTHTHTHTQHLHK